MRRHVPKLALASAAILMLSACGKVGQLEQPAPLWGAKAKADYQARRAAAAAHDEQNRSIPPDPLPDGAAAPIPSVPTPSPRVPSASPPGAPPPTR